MPGPQWFHVDLTELEQVIVGNSYVIELPNSANYKWRGTCGTLVIGDCTAPDPDAYTPGTSSRAGADFGFRTLSAPVLIPPEDAADQHLIGDPDCGPTVFRHTAGGAGLNHQEFVADTTGVKAIDLCINVKLTSTPIEVSIRKGTAAVPGDILQTESTPLTTIGYQWLRIILDPVVATTAGTKYVIEAPTGGAAFEWLGKCGAIAGDCTTVDIYLYLAGVSDQTGGADLSFRTITGVPPGAPTGVADQKLTGDPVCSEDNFKAKGIAPGPFQQEFQPSAGTRGLDIVDLCVNVTDAGAVVQLRIRSGTVAAPGPVIMTISRTAANEGFQFLRFDLPNSLPMRGGTPHLLEVVVGAGFEWRGTCGAVAAGCVAIEPNLYDEGGTNKTAVRDFGFRTVAGTPLMRRLPLIARDGSQ